MTGRLIVFEGADASGKSTQARRLASRLSAELTFQFGATEIGSAIRSILLDPTHAALDDRAEALLVIADKA
ncbi:MAG TPA: dTMP kinase, partial [Acidimicrobiaceae bacterium]|nr:dTMP kinase [Acidimicrobiaceae bacterium]